MCLFENSFSICAVPFNRGVLPLPPNSALIAVCSVWLCVSVCEGSRTLSLRMFYFLYILCWGLLCVSPTLTQRRFKRCVDCFVVEIGPWKGGIEGYRSGLCLCFVVALCFCHFGLFSSHPRCRRLKKSSHPPLSPHSLLLCFTSQEITFYCLFQSQRNER